MWKLALDGAKGSNLRNRRSGVVYQGQTRNKYHDVFTGHADPQIKIFKVLIGSVSPTPICIFILTSQPV
jgi:hypothetical protein